MRSGQLIFTVVADVFKLHNALIQIKLSLHVGSVFNCSHRLYFTSSISFCTYKALNLSSLIACLCAFSMRNYICNACKLSCDFEYNMKSNFLNHFE